MLQMRPGFRENIRNAVSIPYYAGATNVPALSTTKSKFGQSSWFCTSAGTSTFRAVPATNLNFGTGDFTLEYWYNPTALASTQGLVGTRPPSTNGPQYWTSAITGNTLVWYTNGATLISVTNAFTVGSWTSVAIVRRSNTIQMYLNGVASGSSATDNNNYQNNQFIVGSSDYFVAVTELMTGYMDELRVSNIARYTGNYTPATQPFIDDLNTMCLIHFDGPNGSTTLTDDNS